MKHFCRRVFGHLVIHKISATTLILKLSLPFFQTTSGFFTNDVLTEMAKCLLSHYFLLTEEVRGCDERGHIVSKTVLFHQQPPIEFQSSILLTYWVSAFMNLLVVIGCLHGVNRGQICEPRGGVM